MREQGYQHAPCWLDQPARDRRRGRAGTCVPAHGVGVAWPLPVTTKIKPPRREGGHGVGKELQHYSSRRRDDQGDGRVGKIPTRSRIVAVDAPVDRFATWSLAELQPVVDASDPLEIGRAPSLLVPLTLQVVTGGFGVALISWYHELAAGRTGGFCRPESC